MADRHKRPILALLALSALAALGSLRGDLWPGPFRPAEALPALERQALAWAQLAACAGLLALFLRQKLSRAAARQAALAGLGLFAVPALLVRFSSPWVPELTRVAVFGLVPVLAVVLEPYMANTETPRGALGAALTAMAGVLCVFPVELPGSAAAALGLAAAIAAAFCVAAANCRAVAAACAHGAGAAARAAIAAATAALALAAANLVTGRWAAPGFNLAPQAAWVLAVDLPALLLLFWLMAHITAARSALRFVLAALLASLAGIAFFAPPVSARAALGLALMAAGSAWMLLAREGYDSATSTLGLH